MKHPLLLSVHTKVPMFVLHNSILMVLGIHFFHLQIYRGEAEFNTNK